MIGVTDADAGYVGEEIFHRVFLPAQMTAGLRSARFREYHKFVQ